MKPRGGTELQMEYLYKYVDNNLLNKVQITTSVPEKIPLHSSKPNILWQKNSYDQPNIAPWFLKKENHKKYDWYVFNSHWNYEKFRYRYHIPTDRCMVIKNGIDNIEPRKFEKKDKIRIIHHCTPWRGLNVLLGAMQLVENKNIELDVYSSTQVYGDNFKNANDDRYKDLYAQAKKLPNVNYIGYKPNEYIKENLKYYDMFVYPSIWEETFCISLLESMAAGLYCITSNFGALYETGAEFPVYIPYDKNYKRLSKMIANAINISAFNLYSKSVEAHLKKQIDYVNYFYNWKKQGFAWSKFLEGVTNGK